MYPRFCMYASGLSMHFEYTSRDNYSTPWYSLRVSTLNWWKAYQAAATVALTLQRKDVATAIHDLASIHGQSHASIHGQSQDDVSKVISTTKQHILVFCRYFILGCARYVANMQTSVKDDCFISSGTHVELQTESRTCRVLWHYIITSKTVNEQRHRAIEHYQWNHVVHTYICTVLVIAKPQFWCMCMHPLQGALALA